MNLVWLVGSAIDRFCLSAVEGSTLFSASRSRHCFEYYFSFFNFSEFIY